ncbi:uncharacterized protein LOC123259289 [Cotesia glomerata]|uniref:Uncharacterized protein n=1 Tax=Cotesia glomerata TaxID=32391 RepID=A0AAV7I4Q6_COTGL|nr:uncharacterized protein LOC123259289 [Cotesia glomerata]KAH0540889.1 hypothetical protein KQX54_020397 [Cotesia glomerata]
MSNVQKFSNVSQQNKEAGDGDSVPQSLKEALELMDSINRRLEDCAMEWQSKISKQQWKLLNDKSAVDVAWDQSLLARTYFTDKVADETFQKLLVHARSFIENFNTFIILLRGERSIPLTEKKEAQNQISEVPSARTEKSNPVVAPLDLSLLDDKTGQQSERRRSKRLATLNSSRDVQQCFAELIKAKIDLDTKFLGFEAVLNGPNSITMPPTESVSCLCQICSNILGTVIDNEKMLKDVTKPKVRKTSARPTSKRLVKSSRIWKKNHDRKQSLSLGHIDGKSVSPKSNKEC